MCFQIVLLRHAVRQARVCIVSKLIREVKLLRDKNGNEAQRDKNKRKADKLIAEVYALKTIQDDEISKFGIMNEKEVKDILQDQSSSTKDRIISRVVGYKSLNRRIVQFREKFPDYKMHLSEEKKKTKLKKKNSENKKLVAENNRHPQHEDSQKSNLNSSENNEDSKEQNVNSEIIEDSQHDSMDKEICKTGSCDTKNNSHKRRKSLDGNGTALVKKKLPKLVEDNMLEETNKQSSAIKLCSVTKEATVKRFVELLEEQDSIKNAQTPAESTDHERTTVQAKPVDDFFITGSDEEGYRDNRTNASTLYARFDTPPRTLRSSSQIKMQNTRYKNDARGSEAPKYNQFKKQPRREKMTEHNHHSNKESFATRQKEKTSHRANKSANKNNLSDISDREKSIDLHPSWLAKKKQQEVMSQRFQGKKIVFADA